MQLRNQHRNGHGKVGFIYTFDSCFLNEEKDMYIVTSQQTTCYARTKRIMVFLSKTHNSLINYLRVVVFIIIKTCRF